MSEEQHGPGQKWPSLSSWAPGAPGVLGVLGCSTGVPSGHRLGTALACGTTSRALLPLSMKQLMEETLPGQASPVNVAFLSTRLWQS